jgi:hypothetical protein
MIDSFGYPDLAMFQATSGWSVLTEEQRSLFTAYLRRSETWSLAHVLRTIQANVDASTITPAPPSVPQVPNSVPSPTTALPPLNQRNQVPVVIPPTFSQLADLRKTWDKECKEQQQNGSGGKAEQSAVVTVTLTKAEVKRITAAAVQRSRELSGHGRAPHGSYASSSSPATAARDRKRSETAAVQTALNAALQRKRNGQEA